MRETIKLLGCIAASILVLAIPILCALSFSLHWVSFVQWIMLVLTFGDAIFVASCIDHIAEENGGHHDV